MTASPLEERFLFLIQSYRIPSPVREYRWAAEYVGPGRGLRAKLAAADLRDWRFDFAWPDVMVAVEIEGGSWVRGRHTRGGGFSDDARKYNAATAMGWTVLRFTSDLLRDGGYMGQMMDHIRRMVAVLEQCGHLGVTE